MAEEAAERGEAARLDDGLAGDLVVRQVRDRPRGVRRHDGGLHGHESVQGTQDARRDEITGALGGKGAELAGDGREASGDIPHLVFRAVAAVFGSRGGGVSVTRAGEHESCASGLRTTLLATLRGRGC
eukprot:6884710-Prymnesium_polylepis.1